MKKIIILIILTLFYKGCTNIDIKNKEETFLLQPNTMIISPFKDGCVVMSKREYIRLSGVKLFDKEQDK